MRGSRVEITPDLLLRAYAAGIFPMAEAADDPGLFWVEPTERGVLPLDRLHVPDRLRRTVRADPFRVRIDHDFDAVVQGCAAPAQGREKTWISRRLAGLYGELFDLGHCHTVECYDGDRLVGGLYGVRLGAAFFGESMFHRGRDASKVALVHLCARLRAGGFRLLDTQFVTPHLAQFGAVSLPRRLYRQRLEAALREVATWGLPPGELSGAEALALLDAG